MLVDAPRRKNTLAAAVVIVTVGKVIGAALKGPVGALFGGFMGVMLTSASVPVTRRFVWIASRDGKQTVIGPFFRTDEQAFREDLAMRRAGYSLERLVELGDQWTLDRRSGSLPS